MNIFEKRRLELKMSRYELERRSGISKARVDRTLNSEINSISTIAIIAETLGLDITIKEVMSSYQFRKNQAMAKAKKIVALVQGSSQLECQGVEALIVAEMEEQTVHELMSDPRKLGLWSL